MYPPPALKKQTRYFAVFRVSPVLFTFLFSFFSVRRNSCNQKDTSRFRWSSPLSWWWRLYFGTLAEIHLVTRHFKYIKWGYSPTVYKLYVRPMQGKIHPPNSLIQFSTSILKCLVIPCTTHLVRRFKETPLFGTKTATNRRTVWVFDVEAPNFFDSPTPKKKTQVSFLFSGNGKNDGSFESLKKLEMWPCADSFKLQSCFVMNLDVFHWPFLSFTISMGQLLWEKNTCITICL